MRRVRPRPVSAAFAFFVRSLTCHSQTSATATPARCDRAMSRFLNSALASGRKVKKTGSSRTGARPVRATTTTPNPAVAATHHQSGAQPDRRVEQREADARQQGAEADSLCMVAEPVAEPFRRQAVAALEEESAVEGERQGADLVDDAKASKVDEHHGGRLQRRI